jgi:hypothetical protein
MSNHELKGKALEMLATVNDSDSLARILAYIEQFIPDESLDTIAPDDGSLSAEQEDELSKIIRKSRSKGTAFISREDFFKGREKWIKH